MAKALTRKDVEEVVEEVLDRKLDEKLAPYVTKVDLQRELSRFVTIERFDATTRALLDAIEATRHAIGSLRIELNEDLARHVNTMSHELRGWVTAVDDKYRDLPDRVAKLEDVTRR